MRINLSPSVLIPTYNEAENIEDVLRGVITALDNMNNKINYEILVIDDASQDNTADIAAGILTTKGRVIRRSGARSLSLSILDGINQAKGDSFVVMDADGSHPPELVPLFLKEISAGYDLVIGSRYVKGGGNKDFPLRRKVISRIACLVGSFVTGIRDNTSGFFCVRRTAIEGIDLTPSGFKIGLEIFVKANVRSFKEIPFIFLNRKKGKSKLKIHTILQYLCQILNLMLYKASRIGKR